MFFESYKLVRTFCVCVCVCPENYEVLLPEKKQQYICQARKTNNLQSPTPSRPDKVNRVARKRKRKREQLFN